MLTSLIFFQFIIVLHQCRIIFSKEFQVKLGGKIDICCSLKFDPANTLFLWKDNNRIVVLNNNILTESDWKIFSDLYSDFKYEKRDNTICLIKEQATKKEENLQFKCTVIKGMFGITLDNEDLIIKIYEELKFSITPPMVKNASAGETVTVECEATGSPDLKVLWRKEGEGVLSTGASSAVLTIKDVISSMNGDKYTCEASINIPKDSPNSVIKQTTSLNVLFPPEIDVNVKSFHTDLGIKEIVKITVKGNPRPILDCRIMNIAADRIITISEPNPFNYVYELEFDNITMEHIGDYTCSASNNRGTSEKTISLILGPINLRIISPNETSYANYYLLKWEVESKAKINTSKIIINTYENGIDSNSVEQVLEGKDLSPKVLSEGTENNNWQYQFSQHIMNLTSDKMHRISLQMCRKQLCIDAKDPVYVQTQVFNGKNNVLFSELNSPQPMAANNPGGWAIKLMPINSLCFTGANLILMVMLQK